MQPELSNHASSVLTYGLTIYIVCDMMSYLASQLFICDMVDGTVCTVPTVHFPVAADCTVGHNENVDEGVQVKLLELVPASPQHF